MSDLDAPSFLPFDSLCLCASVFEMQRHIGARFQKWVQVDDTTIACNIYLDQPHWFIVSWHAKFCRMLVTPNRPQSFEEPSGLVQLLENKAKNLELRSVKQVGFDRLAVVDLGAIVLRVELMGTQSNFVVCDAGKRVLASARKKVALGKPYSSPISKPRPTILAYEPGARLLDYEGGSPFLTKALEAGVEIESIQRAFGNGKFTPCTRDGCVYPIALPGWNRIEFYSELAARYYLEISKSTSIEAEKLALTRQLEKALQGKMFVLRDLEAVLDTAARSRELQTYGELILAYQHTIQPGDAQLLAYDYEGIERTIKLNSERSPVENANSFFDRAKRAKSRAEEAQTTHGQINQELLKLKKSLVELENSRSTSEISEIRDLAKQQRWLVIQDTPEQRKETRPFDGKRVRELLFNGYKIYYGENSEANDYVTTRLARPNDWWLHVRGGASAHVVVSTANQPTRVPFEVLREAAKIAVKNSPQKHSHLVAVDYTLKKHVRKPRGSATGFVTYTQEKTIDVNPGE